MNVLVSLYKGYGLGDAVQMSAVLRHLRKYRPEWVIDYRAEDGKHQCGRGIAASTFAYGEEPAGKRYDAEAEIILYDTWANWGDRPNTRVSSCLHERFGLGWDAECGRYKVEVGWGVCSAIRMRLPSNARVVAVHYRGDSAKDRKDLTHAQAQAIFARVSALGRLTLLLDWRGEVNDYGGQRVNTTARWPKSWGGDAEYNCAVIRQCEAFVGIDSGPGKCASATDTPALIVWHGHHPAPFHDPATNTTHLVPEGYHGMFPVCDDAGVIAWFEANYNVRFYQPGDPVPAIEAWLGEVLR